MADNNQENDEYEFADLDVINPGSMGEDDKASKATSSFANNQGDGSKDIRRNALIVVGVIVVIVLGYKLAGSLFSKKKAPVTSAPVVTLSTPLVTPQVKEEPPVEAPPAVQAAAENPELVQKFSAMELSQQTLRNDVNNMGSQLEGINSNINAMNSKLANLSQMVANLSATVQKQNDQIEHLLIRRVSIKKSPIAVRRAITPQPIYHIQAVIPGRAWLIATNGTTITVREGTRVAGYGVVKLIDPVQGRVMTSSGRVIRFSQQDS